MKINTDISRKDDGTFITQSGAIQTDIVNLTGQKTVASGVVLIGEQLNNNLFIPNDLSDRQIIIDKLDELADLVNKLNIVVNAIPTSTPDTSIATGLLQLKQELTTIKGNLK